MAGEESRYFINIMMRSFAPLRMTKVVFIEFRNSRNYKYLKGGGINYKIIKMIKYFAKRLSSFLFPLSSKKRGFTIIEILVVFGIMVMLSGVLILYSNSSKNLIALFREQAKVISIISKAKSFALQTYIENGSACGYGTHIDLEKNTIIFFRDLAEKCADSDNVYTPDANSSEIMEQIALSDQVRLKSSTATDVLFIPPDPRVVITQGQDSSLDKMDIILETADGNTQAKIRLNSSGQITVQ